jgi:hypothetical protein
VLKIWASDLLTVYQEIRHALSNFKCHFHKQLGQQAATEEGHEFNFLFKPGEWKQVLRVLDGPQREQGFHLFCKEQATEKKLDALLQARLSSAIEEANEAGRSCAEDILIAHHAIKVGLWSELEEHEREMWRDQAKASNKEKSWPQVSEDK